MNAETTPLHEYGLNVSSETNYTSKQVREKKSIPPKRREDAPPVDIFWFVTKASNGSYSVTGEILWSSMMMYRKVLPYALKALNGFDVNEATQDRQFVSLWKIIDGEWVELDMKMTFDLDILSHFDLAGPASEDPFR